MKAKATIIDDMIKTADDAIDHFQDLVDRHELHAFIKGDELQGALIDEDEQISPEQVAILGGLSVALQIRDNLKLIADGKEVKPKQEKKVNMEIMAFKNGKVTKVTGIPKEVIDAMKQIIADNEEKDSGKQR